MRFQRTILALMIPSVISNITVPLLSLVDTSIVGHMEDANNIGGIYIGSTIFSMIYWVFAFLRMGTTGIVAQSRGAGDSTGVLLGLYRSLLLGISISLLLCILQSPLLALALQFVQPPDEKVSQYAAQYFHVCIWGAPAMLVTYCLSGWFVGMRDTRTPMLMAVTQNVVNIVMSLFFVYILHADIRGVAAGSVTGLYTGVLLGAIVLWKKIPKQKESVLQKLLEQGELYRFVKVNRDLFLRTLCLVIVTVSFTRFSSAMGADVLSANAIAMQFFIFYSYFMDGLANAGEALSGEFAGKKDNDSMHHLVRSLFLIGGVLSVFFAVFYFTCNSPIIMLLTSDVHIYLLACEVVSHWAWIIPLVSLSAFIWDGVFIGLTWSRGMLISTFTALVMFFFLHQSLPSHDSDELWIAFLTYLATRGIVQWIIWMGKGRASCL